MDDRNIRLGVIDESENDRREFLDFFEADFQVVPINIGATPEESVESILGARIDAIAIDFLLKENNSGISYNGNQIFDILTDRLPHFPFFILTHMPEQAELENSDQFRIISKRIYGTDAFDELKRRIRNQVKIYYQLLADSESRLIELIKKQKSAQLNKTEEDEMIRLDEFLEKSFSSKSNVPSDWKRPSGLETLSILTTEVSKLISKLNNHSDE